jgi:hypothetical protein
MMRIVVHIDRVALRNARGTDGTAFGEALRQALAEQLAHAGGQALLGPTSLGVVRATSPVPLSPSAAQLAGATAGSVVGAIRGGTKPGVGV